MDEQGGEEVLVDRDARDTEDPTERNICIALDRARHARINTTLRLRKGMKWLRVPRPRKGQDAGTCKPSTEGGIGSDARFCQKLI